MERKEGIKFLDFDMYSNRISFFSNNREKVGSYFGLVLTIIYIIVSIILIVFHLYDVIMRSEMRVYDSTIYSNTIPSINIDSNILNFAFGLENRISSNRFIDPSIYYPEIAFLDRVKKSGGFETVEKKILNFSECRKEHFGENYNNLLVDNELNNSYCLDKFNLTLTGGYKYDRMSYIRIKIIPCVNSTKSKIKCKPRSIIDNYFSGTYFSILFKDIGLNPSNYSMPVIPTLQDLYTTIDKQIFRDFILNFRINEIQTDTGLFREKIHIQKYLQFLNEQQTFYFRSEDEFYEGKQVCAIQIRLNDIISIQRRAYTKLPETFSVIGGYMQLLSTIFTLLSLLSSKLDLEVKILNELFNFNLKENKMTIKIRTLKDFSKLKNKDYMKNSFTTKKTIFYQKFIKENQNNSLSINNLILNNNNFLSGKYSSNKNLNTSFKNFLNLKNDNDNDNDSNNDNGNNNNIGHTVIKGNNMIDNPKLAKKSLNNNNNNFVYYRPFKKGLNSKFNNNQNNNNQNNINNNQNNNMNLKLNFFDYYCYGNICNKKDQIELFNLGTSLYKKRMDIINVFTIILLIEKILLTIEKYELLDKENGPVIKLSKKKIEL